MDQIKKVVKAGQAEFRAYLEAAEGDGGLSRERYVRYLSMQHHLTNGVQRHFFAAASHPDLAHRRQLRRFLVEFANEEELHYQIAAKDLEALGVEPLPPPLDVKLWWAYFDKVVHDRPFLRLGATCILENIAGTAGDVITRLFAAAPYLTPRNTRFFTIHRHDETLPHGDQILAALEAAGLDPRHFDDLQEGAETGLTIYLRLARWSLKAAA
jgi:hypothetical protein